MQGELHTEGFLTSCIMHKGKKPFSYYNHLRVFLFKWRHLMRSGKKMILFLT